MVSGQLPSPVGCVGMEGRAPTGVVWFPVSAPLGSLDNTARARVSLVLLDPALGWEEGEGAKLWVGGGGAKLWVGRRGRSFGLGGGGVPSFGLGGGGGCQAW